MYNAGDFNTTETVILPVNSFSSDDPTASVTMTNLAAGDVEIHKDGSTTQRSSDSGVSVTIDFDGVTGNHIVSIDLSDNTDAGFYANGSRYLVRIEGVTVDGGTLNAWIGGFSIGCTLRPTTDGRTLDVESGGCAGVDWGNVANPTTAVDLSATDIQLVDTATAVTNGVTLANDAITSAKYDETTAFPVTSADSGATQIARVGADSDTLETLSDQIDTITAKLPSKDYLTGTNNTDGDAEADEFTGEVPATLDDATISTIAGDISTEALETALSAMLNARFAVFID